jgi:hypothetical protein
MKNFFFAVAMLSLLIGPTGLFAQTTQAENPGLEDVRAKYDFQDPLGGVSIPVYIGRIIAMALPVVGALFLVLFIYSGILWMTAGGEEEKVKASIKTMKNAVIGMAIVMGAYFIVTALLTGASALVNGTPTSSP